MSELLRFLFDRMAYRASGVPGTSKDMSLAGIPMPPTTIRTKKRAAMATSVVSMANNPPPPAAIRKSSNVPIYYIFISVSNLCLRRISSHLSV